MLAFCLTVVGSLFLIVGQLPFEGLNQAIAGVFGADWTEPFMQAYSGTFCHYGGWFLCFSIGHSYAKNSGVELLPAGVLVFLLSLSLWNPPIYRRVRRLQMRLPRSGLEVKESLAILIGLAVGSIYTIFIGSILSSKCQSRFRQAIAKQWKPWFQLSLFSCYQWLFTLLPR